MKNSKISKILRERDGDRCHYCSNVMVFDGKNHHGSATVEHLKRKVDGGGSSPRDLVLACMACNRIRGLIDAGWLPKYRTKKSVIQRTTSRGLHKIAAIIK